MFESSVRDIEQIKLPTGFPVGLVNTYLVFGEKLTLIDTGPNLAGNWSLFNQVLEDKQLTIYDIDQVLLTHHHVDHVGLLDRILEVHPIPVLGHPNNRSWLQQERGFMNWYIEFSMNLLQEFGAPAEWWFKAKDTVHMMEQLSCHANLTNELIEGSTIPGLPDWEVIETKGHAQSHLSFYRKKDQILIAGDHIIKHISSNARIDPPLDRNEERVKTLIQYMDSMKKCTEFPVDTVLTGHGDVVRNLSQLVNERFDEIDQRANHIEEILQGQYKSGFEIANELFNPKTVREQLYLIASETIGHLDLLLDRGKIDEKWMNGVRYYCAL